MAPQDATAQAGGPKTEPTGDGIQKGGFTPKAREILDSLDEGHRAVLEGELRQKEQFVSSERQRLATEVQMSTVLKNWLRDPEFQRFVKAKEAGSTPTFYRSELGLSNQNAATNNQDDPVTVSTGTVEEVLEAPGPTPQQATADNKGLLSRMDALDSRLSAHDERARDATIEEFVGTHSDYEQYLPGMQKIKAELPAATLLQMYTLAKEEAQRGQAETSQAGGEPQQQTPSAPATPPAISEQPPLAVGVQSESPSPERPQAKTIAEAWEQSKEELGIKGPIRLEFTH